MESNIIRIKNKTQFISLLTLFNMLIIFICYMMTFNENNFSNINDSYCDNNTNITNITNNSNITNINDTILIYCECKNIIKTLEIYRYTYNIAGIIIMFIIIFTISKQCCCNNNNKYLFVLYITYILTNFIFGLYILKQLKSYNSYCYKNLMDNISKLLINYIFNFWLVIIILIILIIIAIEYLKILNFSIFVYDNQHTQSEQLINNYDHDRLPLYEESESSKPPRYINIYD